MKLCIKVGVYINCIYIEFSFDFEMITLYFFLIV